MKNLKNMDFAGSNLIVYVKTKDSKRYEALASLKTFSIAPNLMYAALYPFEKLDALKGYLSQMLELCQKTNTSFQIRSGNRKTIFYQVN